MGADARALFGPPAQFVEAAEQGEEAVGRGVEVGRELGDLVGEAVGFNATGGAHFRIAPCDVSASRDREREARHGESTVVAQNARARSATSRCHRCGSSLAHHRDGGNVASQNLSRAISEMFLGHV